jgi:UDP-N-acetylmuramate--alanine ligase
MDLNKFNNIFCVGIGGIGVSAVARMFLHEGKSVSGSDRSKSEITDALEKEGVKVFIGEQKNSEIPNSVDLIIYSAAIPVAEPEFFAALKEQKIPALSYSEILGEISKGKFTIAVSGTHGKTTVTGMLATALIDGGIDPTVIVGSILNREKSNFVFGKSDFFVVEADEYKRNFSTLDPKILVINNIDLDHLDYYKDLSDIQSAYRELAMKVPKDGFVVTDVSDPKVAEILEDVKATIIDYKSIETEGLVLSLPGEHNVRNAQAVIAVSSILGIPKEKIYESLQNFQGTWRRFEKVGVMKSGAIIYDDYAHNPQKISAVIAGAKEYFAGKKITIVFQPHLYSRTKTLLNDFATSLSSADRVILADIFPAREAFDSSISSKILADLIEKKNKHTQYFKSFEEIIDEVKKSAGVEDVVITVGAGDIYKIGKELIS